MHTKLPVLCCVLLLTLAACSRPEKAPEAISLSNEALDINIPALPEAWTIRANTGADLRLAPSAAESQGQLRIELAPSDLGSNLVEAVHAHQAEIEARKEGKYLGARELSGPLGTAFYSRGRYLGEGGLEMEETTIFTLHPRKKGILALRYDYPAGDDSSQRVQSMIDLFAELE